MPELPEVERGRLVAEQAVVGRTVTSVYCPRDPILLDGTTPRAVRAALLGRRVRAAHRRGKHLWLELDRPPHPLFHFGMTGSFQALGPDDPRPRSCRIELTVDDGTRLAMPDPRRFGRVRLREDPREESPIADLGFDPLLDMPRPAPFRLAVQRRRAPIKALLLDQSFAAGVGNWIADEVLYQARIDPRRRAHELDAEEVERVRRALRAVIRTATRVHADSSRFPRQWLFHERWGRRPDATTHDGHPIEHLRVGGRTTAWVPAVQR